LAYAGVLSLRVPRRKKNKDKENDETAKTTQEAGAQAWTALPSGLEYKIVSRGKSTRKPQINDHVEINIIIHEGDSVMFDSRKMNNDAPVPLPVSAPKFKGDVMEGFVLMCEGDSAVFRIFTDTFKKAGMPLPPWSKTGEYIEYNVSLVSVRSEEEEKKSMLKNRNYKKVLMINSSSSTLQRIILNR